jgi:hypothetical protein
MAKDLAIVLNSGSINSAVASALAAQRYRLILLHAEVGEGGTRARAAYDQQVAHFKPYREHTLPMPFLATVTPKACRRRMPNDPRPRPPTRPAMIDLLPLVTAGALRSVHAAAVISGSGRGSGTNRSRHRATPDLERMIQMPWAQGTLEVITPLLELMPRQVVDVGSGQHANGKT